MGSCFSVPKKRAALPDSNVMETPSLDSIDKDRALEDYELNVSREKHEFMLLPSLVKKKNVSFVV